MDGYLGVWVTGQLSGWMGGWKGGWVARRMDGCLGGHYSPCAAVMVRRMDHWMGELVTGGVNGLPLLACCPDNWVNG